VVELYPVVPEVPVLDPDNPVVPEVNPIDPPVVPLVLNDPDPERLLDPAVYEAPPVVPEV
jgi:hypothetical protein